MIRKYLFFPCLLMLLCFGMQRCALLTAAGITSQGQPTKDVPQEFEGIEKDKSIIDHQPWTNLLQKYVDQEGNVDYKGFKEDREKLQTYLETLSSKEPTDEWPVQELLAYYINLYNAYTVDLILEHYPVKSIKDIKGAWTKAIVPIGKRKLALGGIENGILRKMNEPRIHFAINCASISCPKLMNEAFMATKIDEQLEKAASEFINSNKNDISATSPKVSSIFDWYKKDYIQEETPTVIDYINQYAETKIQKGTTLTYLDYNWDLNEQK